LPRFNDLSCNYVLKGPGNFLALPKVKILNHCKILRCNMNLESVNFESVFTEPRIQTRGNSLFQEFHFSSMQCPHVYCGCFEKTTRFIPLLFAVYVHSNSRKSLISIVVDR